MTARRRRPAIDRTGHRGRLHPSASGKTRSGVGPAEHHDSRRGRVKTRGGAAIPPASYPVALVLASLPAIAPPRATADSWGPPRKEHWATNQRFVLKVSWGIGSDETLTLWEKTEGGLRRRW